jgi:sugar O-acyltransferase (sialic acid O-acetyltransferase NeuD family)
MFGLPVISFEDIEKRFPQTQYKMLIAVGYKDMNRFREKKYLEAKSKGYKFISFVENNVKKFDNMAIGENCIVLDNVTLQPYVEIGNNCVIWSNVTIAHGTKIGDNCWIASGAVVAGDAVIKTNCFIGINASIGHNVNIGTANFIGASAQICKNTNPNDVYIAEQATKFRLGSEHFMQFAQT